MKGGGDTKDSWKKRCNQKNNKHGVVDGASNGKTLFNVMIQTVSNKFLDYSIIDINKQNLINIGQIRKGLNKEFEWDGPLVVLHEHIEKVIGLFHGMKKVKIEKAMGLWSCMPPTYINTHEWENLKTCLADIKFNEIALVFCLIHVNVLLFVGVQLPMLKNVNYDFMTWVVCFVGSG